MRYKPLKNRFLTVDGEEALDAGDGLILIPLDTKKTYVHWLNEKGKLVATYTLTYPTLIMDKVKLISTEKARIHIVEP
jgi:hypothetical protein